MSAWERFACAALRIVSVMVRTVSALERFVFEVDWMARALHSLASTMERNWLMPEQRIPRPDGNFTAWSSHYFEAVTKFWNDQGLDANDLKPLEEAQAAWAEAYAAYVQAEAAYNAALEAKRAARAEFESAIRPVSAFIQTYFKTTDADRASIGITVKDTGGTPVPQPATAPLVSITLDGRLKHRLRIVDEDTPLKLAKPHGVRGCEVWMKLVDSSQTLPRRDGSEAASISATDDRSGENATLPSENAPRPSASTPRPSASAPLLDPFLADPATFTYQGTATRAHHVTEFPLEARGKSAVYMLRWVSTRGAPGPWSPPHAATVAA